MKSNLKIALDVVLGNPPWESIQNRNVDSNAREKEDRIVAAQQQFLATSRLFPHSGKGRKNLYALFVELSVKVKSTQASNLAKVIYANSITLTPGTISIDLDGSEIEVHSLSKEGVVGLKKGIMDKKITDAEVNPYV